jgi:hypothetical protein
VVAHKTGTGGTQNGITSATNDIGIILCPMVDTSPWPHSSPIPPPMMRRGMRSSPAWPKPPGIARNR